MVLKTIFFFLDSVQSCKDSESDTLYLLGHRLWLLIQIRIILISYSFQTVLKLPRVSRSDGHSHVCSPCKTLNWWVILWKSKGDDQYIKSIKRCWNLSSLEAVLPQSLRCMAHKSLELSEGESRTLLFITVARSHPAVAVGPWRSWSLLGFHCHGGLTKLFEQHLFRKEYKQLHDSNKC